MAAVLSRPECVYGGVSFLALLYSDTGDIHRGAKCISVKIWYQNDSLAASSAMRKWEVLCLWKYTHQRLSLPLRHVIIYLWKYIFELKQVALSYSFQYWLFPNSQYDKMNSYSRIQQPSASFSVANISRMASGMSCINKYSLLTYWLVINVYITHNTINCRQFTS